MAEVLPEMIPKGPTVSLVEALPRLRHAPKGALRRCPCLVPGEPLFLKTLDLEQQVGLDFCREVLESPPAPEHGLSPLRSPTR